MRRASRKNINSLLTLIIILLLLTISYVVLCGGINIHCVLPLVGAVKITVNKLANPLLLLLCVVLLKLIVYRRAPVPRTIHWYSENKKIIAYSLILCCVAGIPRLLNLNGNDLNSDELLWMERGPKLVYHLRTHDLKNATAHLGHPGVIPALLIGTSYIYLGGNSSTLSFDLLNKVVAARLPIAVIGILTCLLVFLLGRIILTDQTAFWGALFLALYPPHISLSRVAHIDSSLACFFFLSIICYFIALDTESLRWKIASGLFFGFALLTKAPALLIPIIVFACKALYIRTSSRKKNHLVATSDLIWIGIGFATYFIFFTKLWYDPRTLEWVKYSRFLPQVIFLIKLINAVGSLPWIQITIPVAAISFLIVKRRLGTRITATGWNSFPLFLREILLGLSALSFLQIFRRPIINELLLASKVYRVEDVGHLKYWMGEIVSSPPHWFYPFMLITTAQPLLTIFFFYGFYSICRSFVRKDTNQPALPSLLLTPLIFVAILSFAHKMALRYIAPAFPFLCIVSAYGFVNLVDTVSKRLPARQRPGLIPIGRYLIATAIITLLAIPLFTVYPQYDLYHNIFIGGPCGAARLVSVGWGEGTKETVAYLKSAVQDEDAIYALGPCGEFRFYWKNDPPPSTSRVLINHTKPPHADWLVISRGHRQRKREREMLTLAKSLQPVHSVVNCGIRFMDIYKLSSEPIRTDEIVEAEDIAAVHAKIQPDSMAGNGWAVKCSNESPEAFSSLHGPYRRYAGGCWEALFRLRAADGEHIPQQSRIAITGISERDVIASSTLSPSTGIPTAEYTDHRIDFFLDRPHRIAFSVTTENGGSLLIDKVTLQRCRPVSLLTKTE
jgi:4-amino-4-deoxy-L-arabinose transferase-like glycosyltransferase